jgi:hypothetical protein
VNETIDPDFASLLEREPLEEEEGRAIIRAHPGKEGAYVLLRQALHDSAARIKELEGVLVAVRAKLGALSINPLAGYPAECTRVMYEVRELISLLSETLDPCKPWCVLEPGHGGACYSDVEFCEDES